MGNEKLSDKRILTITSGGTPSRGNPAFYNGKIMWLKSGELNDSEKIVASEEYITEEALKKSSAKIFPRNTVLFAMYGATAGKLGILDAPGATNQAVAGLICNEQLLDYKYLFYNLLKLRKSIIAKAWGGAQPNLSQSIIKRFEIPLPSLDEQKKIVDYLDKFSEKSRELQNIQSSNREDFVELRQSILAKAFSGKFNQDILPVENKVSVKIFPIQQAIAAILHRDFERGEMVIAKVLYLAQEIYKVPLNIPFSPQNFGPYDQQVKKAITAGLAKSNRFFKKKMAGQFMVYALDDGSGKLLRYSNSKISMSMETALDSLMPIISKAKSAAIELLATVCKAVQDTRSVDSDIIKKYIVAWKPNKFTDANIQKMLDFIKTKKWEKILL